MPGIYNKDPLLVDVHNFKIKWISEKIVKGEPRYGYNDELILCKVCSKQVKVSTVKTHCKGKKHKNLLN